MQVEALLTIALLHADSVDYYESTVDESLGLDGYYSEQGNSPASAFVFSQNEDDFSHLESYLGVKPGQKIDSQSIRNWFNRAVAPSGRLLGSRPGTKTRPGFDLTFCAPKSVSLLWAFANEDVKNTVDLAHKQAVDAALDYLSSHAAYTRRGADDDRKRMIIDRTLGLSGVRYEHKTSRAGDPHTHTHVLLANKQLCPDGKVRSLDSKSLFHESRAAGIIYKAVLRQVLTQKLGVSWGEVTNGCAEIIGLDDKDLLRSFSTRTREIDAWIQANGTDNLPQFERMAQKITRRAKDVNVTLDELESEWKTDSHAQVIRSFVDSLVVQDESVTAENKADCVDIDEILRAVSAEKSTFTRADLVEKTAELWVVNSSDASCVLQDVEAVVDQILEKKFAFAVNPNEHMSVNDESREGSIRYTTQAVIDEVNTGIDVACQVVGRGVNSEMIQPVEGKLSDAQAEAMRTIVASPYLASVVVAPAGAGKTSSLKAARKAWEQAGKTVVGLAPTGKAADVMVGENVAHESSTIAKAFMKTEGLSALEVAKKLGWNQNTVVVVDEAGMVGTPDINHILETVSAAKARVVFVGDPHQYGAVKQRSGMLATLSYELPDTVELTEVFRQKNVQERQASKWLRDGAEADIERAADWYANNGRLHSGNRSAMIEDVLTAWAADVDAGKDALMVASTREDVAELNQLAQQISGTCLAESTSAKAADGMVFEGDIILTRRNSYQITNSAGEPLRNGQRWTVVSCGDDGVVASSLDNPDVSIVLPSDYVKEHVTLGYATTGHASQGVTVDTCHVLAGIGSVDRAGVYVPLTRGREENHLYLAEKMPGDADTSPFELAEEQLRRDEVQVARDLLVQAAQRDRKDVTPHQAYRQARIDFELARISSGQRYDTDPYRGTRIAEIMRERELKRQERLATHQANTSAGESAVEKSVKLPLLSDFRQEVSPMFVLPEGIDDLELYVRALKDGLTSRDRTEGRRFTGEWISRSKKENPFARIQLRELAQIAYAPQAFEAFIEVMREELENMQPAKQEHIRLEEELIALQEKEKSLDEQLNMYERKCGDIEVKIRAKKSDFDELNWVKQQFAKAKHEKEVSTLRKEYNETHMAGLKVAYALKDAQKDIDVTKNALENSEFSYDTEQALEHDLGFWSGIKQRLDAPGSDMASKIQEEIEARLRLGYLTQVFEEAACVPDYHNAPWTRWFADVASSYGYRDQVDSVIASINEEENRSIAIEYGDDLRVKTVRYYQDGQLHREEDAAVIEYDRYGVARSEEFWLNGEQMSEADFYIEKSLKYYKESFARQAARSNSYADEMPNQHYYDSGHDNSYGFEL